MLAGAPRNTPNLQPSTPDNAQDECLTLAFHAQEKTHMAAEPLLSTACLCVALSEAFGGVPVHPDRIRRRLKMGLPHEVDRGNGRKLFRLSEVLEWWVTPRIAKVG